MYFQRQVHNLSWEETKLVHVTYRPFSVGMNFDHLFLAVQFYSTVEKWTGGVMITWTSNLTDIQSMLWPRSNIPASLPVTVSITVLYYHCFFSHSILYPDRMEPFQQTVRQRNISMHLWSVLSVLVHAQAWNRKPRTKVEPTEMW